MAVRWRLRRSLIFRPGLPPPSDIKSRPAHSHAKSVWLHPSSLCGLPGHSLSQASHPSIFQLSLALPVSVLVPSIFESVFYFIKPIPFSPSFPPIGNNPHSYYIFCFPSSFLLFSSFHRRPNFASIFLSKRQFASLAPPRYATGRHRYKPILSMEIIPIFFTSQARKLTVYFLFG